MGITFDSEAAGPGIPVGAYTVQIARIGSDWVERENFDKNGMELQAEFRFKIVDTPSDLDEEDRDQWLGYEFDKWIRKPRKLSNEAGNLNQLIRAALNVSKLTDDDRFDSAELTGKKFTAIMSTSDSGYPRIDKYAPLKKKAKAAPKPVVEEEDDEDFPE